MWLLPVLGTGEGFFCRSLYYKLTLSCLVLGFVFSREPAENRTHGTAQQCVGAVWRSRPRDPVVCGNYENHPDPCNQSMHKCDGGTIAKKADPKMPPIMMMRDMMCACVSVDQFCLPWFGMVIYALMPCRRLWFVVIPDLQGGQC